MLDPAFAAALDDLKVSSKLPAVWDHKLNHPAHLTGGRCREEGCQGALRFRNGTISGAGSNIKMQKELIKLYPPIAFVITIDISVAGCWALCLTEQFLTVCCLVKIAYFSSIIVSYLLLLNIYHLVIF